MRIYTYPKTPTGYQSDGKKKKKKKKKKKNVVKKYRYFAVSPYWRKQLVL